MDDLHCCMLILLSIHYGSSAIVSLMVTRNDRLLKTSHIMRRRHNIHPLVSFTAETQFCGKKEEFMATDSNKQRLIWMLSDELRKRGCTVDNAPGDADVLIIKVTVEKSLQHSTTLIGEDTDLLVLLLYYVQDVNKDLYL